ncbi:MAG: serine hydrolase domain-containing protein [Acidobacteriota bacterium]|nr:serine hydrolase domain-containing protein [Acidobacteriota bacterium]
MYRMITSTLCFFTFLLPVFATEKMPFAEPAQVGLSESKLNLITQLMEKEVEDGEISGAVTLIARRGKIAYLQAAGYQSLEASIPMQTDSIFRIMSISKAITSVAIMKLQEEGKLMIYEPVSKYIPELANPMVITEEGTRPASREITIRDLLTHHSGTPYIGLGGPLLDAVYAENDAGDFNLMHLDETLGEYIKRVGVLPLAQDPGISFQYGWATDILGYVVEVASGETLDDYFRNHIFQPLGMTDAGFYLPQDQVDRFTSVYIQNDGRGDGISLFEAYDDSPFVKEPRKLYSGAGGVICTAEDFAYFCQMILNKGKLRGQRIISSKSVTAMTTNQIEDRKIMEGFRFWGDKFGLGFGIRAGADHDIDIESPGTLAFSGVYFPKFWIDPEEELIVIFFTQLLPDSDVDADYRGIAAQIKIAAWAAIDDDLAPRNFKK